MAIEGTNTAFAAVDEARETLGKALTLAWRAGTAKQAARGPTANTARLCRRAREAPLIRAANLEGMMRNSDQDGSPVTVLASGDPAVVAVAESLLEDAGIEFFAIGEGVQDLFGAGRIGGFSPVVGPVRIQVAAEDADEAAALLQELPAK